MRAKQETGTSKSPTQAGGTASRSTRPRWRAQDHASPRPRRLVATPSGRTRRAAEQQRDRARGRTGRQREQRSRRRPRRFWTSLLRVCDLGVGFAARERARIKSTIFDPPTRDDQPLRSFDATSIPADPGRVGVIDRRWAAGLEREQGFRRRWCERCVREHQHLEWKGRDWFERSLQASVMWPSQRTREVERGEAHTIREERVKHGMRHVCL